MTPAERAAVVDGLPASMSLEEETRPPEGDPHRDAKMGAFEVLRSFFHKLGRRVYVAAELTVYYPDEPRFSPDVLAVVDVDPHPRMKWVVSAEGKGLDFVLEVHVAGHARKDLEQNVERYARLGIGEYFILDEGRHRLSGFRLEVGAHRYQAIPPVAGGRLHSTALGLDLVVEDERLRFYEGTAALLEERELRERLERMVAQVQRRVEEEKQRAEEGLARGRVEQARTALLRVLDKRGFKLPIELEERVMAEDDLDRLERWHDAAVTARQVQEVFQDS